MPNLRIEYVLRRAGNVFSKSAASLFNPCLERDVACIHQSSCRFAGDTNSAHRLATALPLMPRNSANSELHMNRSCDNGALGCPLRVLILHLHSCQALV